MISLVWGMIGAVCGILWLGIEIMAGMHSAGYSHATLIIWVVIPVLTVVGALLHGRRAELGAYPYMRALTTGLSAGAVLLGIDLLVWFIFTQMIEPEFFSMMVKYAIDQAKLAGAPPNAVLQQAAASSVIFKNIGSFLLVTTIVTGAVAATVSAVVAIFARKK
ncbi:hypothetical protein BH10BAC6_BH10BAC6_14470 [soil metagenome]